MNGDKREASWAVLTDIISQSDLTLKTDNKELNLRLIFSFRQIVWHFLDTVLGLWFPSPQRKGELLQIRPVAQHQHPTAVPGQGSEFSCFESKVRMASPRVKQEGLCL